jgi:hypothetical protein
MNDLPPRRLGTMLGMILCRIVVPAWIMTGAVFKLVEAKPSLLPRGIIQDGARLGVNLDYLLATLISLEFFAALVIFFVGRLARVTALVMMSIFVLVLIREIAAGRTSCGCLGAASPSPWVMLAVDGVILLGLIFLKPRPLAMLDRARWPYVAVAILSLAAAATSFAMLIPRGG